MPGRNLVPARGYVRRGVVHLYSRVVLGTSGAIASQTDVRQSGMTLVKTATKTGRYTVTLQEPAQALLWADAKVIGADDTAYTTAKGLDVLIRDDDVTSDKTFKIQFARTDTAADAEVENSRVLLVHVTVSQSGV